MSICRVCLWIWCLIVWGCFLLKKCKVKHVDLAFFLTLCTYQQYKVIKNESKLFFSAERYIMLCCCCRGKIIGSYPNLYISIIHLINNAWAYKKSRGCCAVTFLIERLTLICVVVLVWGRLYRTLFFRLKNFVNFVCLHPLLKWTHLFFFPATENHLCQLG